MADLVNKSWLASDVTPVKTYFALTKLASKL